MQNKKNFKPLLSELIELLKQQKEVAENLTAEFENYEKNDELDAMWQAYLKKLQEQDELIFKFAKKLEITFENDLYKEIVAK